MSANRRTIDIQDTDEEFIKQFTEDIHFLCEMVKEMMVDNPATLLSPLFRGMLAERAKDLEKKRSIIAHYLCADNLGKPFNEVLKNR